MNDVCLTVTLNPAVDKIVEIPGGLQPGQEYRVRDWQASAGGKGINVARALRRLGGLVRTTGFLGGEAGRFIRRALAAERLPDDFVNMAGETRTCLTVMDPGKKQQTRIIPDGPAVSAKEIRRFLGKFKKLMRHANWIVFSGRGINGAGDDFYAELISRAKQQGKTVLLDTSGEALRQGLLARPDFVKPNRAEAEFIVGRKIRTSPAAITAAQKILSYGVKGVILSLGQEGILAAYGQGMWAVQPPAVEARHTVGCGDAAVAGFVYGSMRKYPFKKAVLWAAAAGTANVMGKQPGDISLQKIRTQLADFVIQDVR